MESTEIIVIGAGLAGLTAALELAEAGRQVVVFDSHRLPRHKVCGEYLSMEVVPYLNSKGVDLSDAPEIGHLLLATPGGRSLRASLPLGAVGISRYALDQRLYEAARAAGVRFVWQAVEAVSFSDHQFRVRTRENAYSARLVLGAWGKRSRLDRLAGRPFFSKPSPWMGIKMHYQMDYPGNQVGLYAFRGGYGGLSVTETGAVNFCYLIHRDRFKNTPDLEACTRLLASEHPLLAPLLSEAKPLFPKALGISNISFHPKKLGSNHILMAGDAARLIHPLCGNGMAMAIEGGRLLASLTTGYIQGKIRDLDALEKEYSLQWQGKFRQRLRFGSLLQQLLLHPRGLEIGVGIAGKSPRLVQQLIEKTHGRP
ncbi:NAD(P)/FAD-dependent oxidoreductase [Robiginitalea marina]|uniref:NAD(P)/FAD-dependent oxidoreductase n=1 Tax=Robiginitalea marina TaxID=2954105 RepID=A0ABT1AU17_9FLAO|nr:NAD(P)/FAD-dependent oxidoreductase [Robiginitalea marina]